jgi:hypothetical protein
VGSPDQLDGAGGGEDEHAWVASWVSEAIDAVEATAGAAASLLIGKSLASLAAPVAADRGLPAVWPTPMLTDERAVAALRRAVAPCLLMGGRLTRCGMAGSRGRSRRTSWRSTGPITECSSWRLAKSAVVLGQVITAVENFLDHQVWPQGNDNGTGSASQAARDGHSSSTRPTARAVAVLVGSPSSMGSRARCSRTDNRCTNRR